MSNSNNKQHDLATVEALAALAHEQWSGWMEYLFSKGLPGPGGMFMLPAWAVTRWQRQIQTRYEDLSPEEQASDRQEAYRVLDLLARLQDAQ